MEQVAGIEPALSAWQAEVLTAILYLHGVSIADAGSVRLNLLFFVWFMNLLWRVEPATGVEPATY